MELSKNIFLVTVLIIINVIMVYKHFLLTTELELKKRVYGDKLNENKLKRWDLIGEKINLLNINKVDIENKFINLRVIALFTKDGYGTCLRDEIIVWRRIYNNDNSIELLPIIVDKDPNNLNKFLSSFKPAIPIYSDTRLSGFLPPNITVRIMILSTNNVILNYFDIFSNQGDEREKIHKFIENFIN